MTKTATKMAPARGTQEMIPRGAFSVDPLRNLDRQMGRLLNRVFGDRFSWADPEESFSLSTWSPACDIFETNEEFLVKADLPEV